MASSSGSKSKKLGSAGSSKTANSPPSSSKHFLETSIDGQSFPVSSFARSMQQHFYSPPTDGGRSKENVTVTVFSAQGEFVREEFLLRHASPYGRGRYKENVTFTPSDFVLAGRGTSVSTPTRLRLWREKIHGECNPHAVRFRSLRPREIHQGEEEAWYADGETTVPNEHNTLIAYAYGELVWFGLNVSYENVSLFSQYYNELPV